MTIEHAPPRTRLDDDKFMAVWPRMDPELQGECLRMEREIKRGIAGHKDRVLGRPKRDMSGFFGLELAEEDVYRLEQTPRKAAELAKARAHLSELRASLAEEDAQYKHEIEMQEQMEPYRKHAEAQGMTLAQYIRHCRDIELALSRDVTDGLFRIADWIGFDPVEMLQGMARAPDNRQVTQ